jgi:hypothetical protein
VASDMGAVRRIVHLDSEGNDCEIDVIAVNRELSLDLQPVSSQGSREFILESSDQFLAELVSDGASISGGITHATARIGRLGTSNSFGDGLSALAGSTQQSSVGVRTGMIANNPANSRLRALPAYGQITSGITGDVFGNDGIAVGVNVETLNSTRRLNGGSHLSSSLFGGQQGSSEFASGGVAPQRFSNSLEKIDNGSGRTVVFDGDSLGGDAGSVAFSYDRCVSVKRSISDSHVYDYTTATGWMVANGLIVHNSALDDRTRDDHIDAHGQTVPLGDDFVVGGESGPGPGMIGSAEQDINCRCAMTAALDVPLGEPRSQNGHKRLVAVSG